MKHPVRTATMTERRGATITIREIIESADGLQNSPLSDAKKRRALSELDAHIYEDIVLRHEGAEAYMIPAAGGGYTHRVFPYESDTAQLIAPARFRKMYVYYLCLEADLANDEPERYSNDLLLFQQLYAAFGAYYNETHMPLHHAVICTAPAYQRGGAYAG